MTALSGTSVSLEELIEVVGASIRDASWTQGVNLDLILAHDFSDPKSRLDIEARHSSNRVAFHGSQVWSTTHYVGQQMFWLSDGKILTKLPDKWRQELHQALITAAPDIVDSHQLRVSATAPHPHLAIIQWKQPDYVSAYPRRLCIYGPMQGKAQIANIIKLIRQSIAEEAPTAEAAIEMTRGELLAKVEAVANGRPLPRIEWSNQVENGTVRAALYLIGTDLCHHSTVLHASYRAPHVESYPELYSGDKAALEGHYRYLDIYERQGGMLRLSALAKWLCGREDGTIQGVHRTFSKDLLGRGTVKIELKKGRFEATYKSDKLTIQTGKVVVNLPSRYPESVIASLKGKPLSALLGLDGISEHIIITSLGYEGNTLIGRLRDTSQYFLDGEIIVDKLSGDDHVSE